MAEELSLEEQKKMVLPYMQRAQEVERVDPKVAYYCRLYAVDQALSITKRAKEINGLVAAALGKLEKDKARMEMDKEQDRVHCEAFALRVFANSDKVDRSGRADSGTAKGFLAASYFLDILNQFGPLDADLTGKQKYALWRAAEISKAVREGRPPVPPPSAESAAAAMSEDGSMGGSFSMAGIKSLDGSTLSVSEPADKASTYAHPTEYSTRPPPPPQPEPTLQQWQPDTTGASYQAPPAGPPPPSHSDWAPAQQDGSAYGMTGGSATAPAGRGGQVVLPGQRFKPGNSVLYCESAGIGAHSREEKGTMAQVTQDADGDFRYRVALSDRFVDANDMQVAPYPAEGTPVMLVSGPSGRPIPARVVLVNDGMGWPPTYLVALEDGTERSALAHELSLFLFQEPSGTAEQTSMPPPPPPPQYAAQPPQGASEWSGFGGSQMSAGQGAGWGSGGPGGYPSVHAHNGVDNAPTPPPLPPTHVGNPGAGRGGAPPYPANIPPPQGAGNPAAGAGTRQTSTVAAAMRTPIASPPSGTLGASPPQLSQPVLQQPPAAAGWISIPALQPGFKPSVHAITEAQKAARTAVSSLNFEDVASAVKYLTHAIEVLTTSGQR